MSSSLPFFRIGIHALLVALLVGTTASIAFAQDKPEKSGCGALPDHAKLTDALKNVVTPGDTGTNGGLANNEWAVVVDRGGNVCAVTYSGEKAGDQWPGSRGIAAAKAFTANGFSLQGFALSTANLYFGTQPGQMLYGAGAGNPIAAAALYKGTATDWGTTNDPLVGKRAGGTIAFGGGLPLYNSKGKLVGGLGVSGDTSCTDHIVAWKTRHDLNFDDVPDGVTPDHNDNIIHDISVDPGTGQPKSASGYGHPTCDGTATEIAQKLEQTHPTGAGE